MVLKLCAHKSHKRPCYNADSGSIGLRKSLRFCISKGSQEALMLLLSQEQWEWQGCIWLPALTSDLDSFPEFLRLFLVDGILSIREAKQWWLVHRTPIKLTSSIPPKELLSVTLISFKSYLFCRDIILIYFLFISSMIHSFVLSFLDYSNNRDSSLQFPSNSSTAGKSSLLHHCSTLFTSWRIPTRSSLPGKRNLRVSHTTCL